MSNKSIPIKNEIIYLVLLLIHFITLLYFESLWGRPLYSMLIYVNHFQYQPFSIFLYFNHFGSSSNSEKNNWIFLKIFLDPSYLLDLYISLVCRFSFFVSFLSIELYTKKFLNFSFLIMALLLVKFWQISFNCGKIIF